MTQPYGYGPPLAGPYYPPPPPTSPAGQPLAEFGDRVLAHLIDSAIMIAAISVVAVVPGVVILFRLMDDSMAPYDSGPVDPARFLLVGLAVELGIGLVALAAYYVYSVELMFRTGQTVGKRAMKIRVVPIDPRLALTRGTAAKRWAVGYLPSMLVPFWTLLDGLWQLWDKPYRQTLHDKAAQTVVIRVSP